MPWEIDGRAIDVVSGTPTATYDGLSLSVLVDESDISSWRARYDVAGDIEVVGEAHGGFRTLARSATGRAVTVTPAAADSPPFVEAAHIPAGYADSPIGTGREYIVDLELRRVRPREPIGGYGVAYGLWYGVGAGDDPATADIAAGDWRLAFAEGTVVAPADAVLPPSESASRLASYDLGFLLDDEQASTVIRSAAYLDAVTEQQIPDGDSRIRDGAGGQNAVRITAPPATDVPDGRYVVQDWALEPLDEFGGVWRVELTAVLDERQPTAGQYGGVRYGHFRYGHADD